jgi:hypothetical protein
MLSTRRNNVLALIAQSLDAEFHNVSLLKPDWRF